MTAVEEPRRQWRHRRHTAETVPVGVTGLTEEPAPTIEEVKVKAPNVVLFEAVGGAPVAVEKDATRKALPMGELYLVTITDVPEAKRYRVIYYEYRHPKMGEHHYAHLSSVPRVLRHTDSGRLTRETHVTAEHSADEMRVYFPDWFIAYFDEKHPHKLKPEEKV